MRRLVGTLFAASIATLGSAQPGGSETAIKALRSDFNKAIADHDVPAMRRFLADDYTILPGSSGTPSGKEAFLQRLVQTFTDPAFVTYVRTPERVTIAQNGKRAAETGRWVGIWRTGDGETRLSGIYQATWIPAAESWLLKNESYVSLDCAGNRCSTVF